MFWGYVLRNSEGRFYIGHTDDLSARLGQHNNGEARWTSSRGPWDLVHFEEFSSRSEAMKRERQLKSGRASQDLKQRLSR
jgi:predicted GIY-YIG superfamily endonuclease